MQCFNNINTQKNQHEMSGDRRKLHQILLQLASNACKFTHSGSITITITPTIDYSSPQLVPAASTETTTTTPTNTATVETEKNPVTKYNMKLVITVKDTGIGISPRFVNQIFQPFSQQDNRSTRKYGGVGIGLATVKKYVDVMQGSITFVSVEHQGTTFTLEVPLLGTETTRSRSHSTASPIQKLQRKHSLQYVLLNEKPKNSSIDSPVSSLSVTKEVIATVEMKLPSPIATTSTTQTVENEKPQLQHDDESIPNPTTIPRQQSSDDCSVDEASSTSSGTAQQQMQNAPVIQNVLVVDDNVINLKVFGKMLEKLNVNHTCAHSGREAIEALNKQDFDLVLMDVEMPDMK